MKSKIHKYHTKQPQRNCKRLLLFFIIISINSGISFGQTTFHKVYGNNGSIILSLSTCTKTKDGGYVIAGTTLGSIYSDGSELFSLKTDSMGVLQSATASGIIDTDSQVFHVNSAMDGGYIIAGYFDNDISGSKTVLMKTGGNVEWTKIYGNNWGSASYVLQTADKGYLVITSDGLLKTDSMGTQQWLRNITNVYVNSIQQTSDGNYIIMGNAGSPGKIYLSKISVNDTIWWEKYLTNPAGVCSAYSFQETLDKGFIINGSINNAASLIKTDSSGVYQWANKYAWSNKLSISSVIQAKDGGFAFTGTDSAAKKSLLFKTTSNGSLQWAKAIDTSNNTSSPIAIFQTGDNGYVIGGNTTGSIGSLCYLIKTDSTGSNNCFEYTINPIVSSLSLSTVLAQTTRYAVLGTDSTIVYQSVNNSYEEVYCMQVNGIDRLAQQNPISVYPNPTSNKLIIETNTIEKQTLQLYDINGKLVLAQTINGKDSINTSNLAEGVYNLSIISNKGITNKRIVIIK